MKKISFKILKVIVIIVLTVSLFEARWYFNKPKYEKTDLSIDDVLSLSEVVFGYQMKRGFNGTLIPARSFFLKVFDGYPDRSFYSRFDEGDFPRVRRGWLKNRRQRERIASLSIDEIVDKHEYISVLATINYCYDKIESIEYQVVREDSSWRVEQSIYSIEKLANLNASKKKSKQDKKRRCTSIIQ
jgi:hypothetical protein